MKRVCLFLLISFCLSGYGQSPDTLNKKGFRRKLITDAKVAEKIIQAEDNRKKDKGNIIIWIGAAVLVLGAGVVLIRKRKKLN